MFRTLMKSKLHRATVTGANLSDMGSITLDRDLMALADILPHECDAADRGTPTQPEQPAAGWPPAEDRAELRA
jgi:hypothetical protein